MTLSLAMINNLGDLRALLLEQNLNISLFLIKEKFKEIEDENFTEQSFRTFIDEILRGGE